MFVGKLIYITSMIKSLFTTTLLLLSLSCMAQQGILFSNKNTKKEVLVKSGDLVKFSYKGYLGQHEVKSGVVMDIQDSVVELISTLSSGKISLGTTETRFILIKDITGFRKFHRSRPYLMTLSSVAITIGSIYLYYVVDKRTNLNFGEKFGLSLGSGIFSTLVVRGFFPERIKNKIGDAWEVKVLK
jgi:hypothetical protein